MKMKGCQYHILSTEGLLSKTDLNVKHKHSIENLIQEFFGTPAEPEVLLLTGALRSYLYQLMLENDPLELMKDLDTMAAGFVDGWQACRQICNNPKLMATLRRN